MGYEDVELKHVSFGTVLGSDGRPFKTRQGDTVGLKGLLDEATAERLLDESRSQTRGYSFTSIVVLLGVVVNNAILIVHQSLNHMRDEGMEPRAAIREAVGNRVRPIFMSVSTSVCGMLPLVLFPGAGSELYRGLGSVVVGGLVVSTLFTLFLVPALFSLALDARAWVARRLERFAEPAPEPVGTARGSG